jgi:arylsulfatase A-like enzyme/tetratricopeptide (TPR) repeat protein
MIKLAYRARLLVVLSIATTAIAAFSQTPPAAPSSHAPIILITLDTTRADHLGAWGWRHARTPHLDGLAARGVRFARCDTAVPITLPSHATILTGRYPPRHGVRDNAIFSLPAHEESVAEALQTAGWQTAAVVSATVLARHYGLSQGFDHYDDRLIGDRRGEAVERRANATTDAALELLGDLHAPYFLWVHYYDPHEPYEPPSPWRQGGTGPHAAYDAEIAFMDAQIGRLLRALPDNARVVVVGDHGEMLGDGGEASHGLLLGPGARRVPLIVAGGDLTRGKTVDCLVRTADVAPTIRALAGLGPRGDVDGVSLLPLARGGACDESSLSYAESFLPFFSYRWYPLRALSDGRELYLHGRRPALYNLVADPQEVRDLATSRPRVTDTWARRLERTLATMGATLETSPGNAQPLSDEERARLASLGYVSGASSGGTVDGDLPDPRDMVDVARIVQEAHDLVNAGRCDEALPKLTAVLRRDPNNVPAYNQSGLCLQTSGRLRSALNAFRRAAQVNPQSAVPVRNAGNVLIQLGDTKAAEETFARALVLDPRSPGVAANLSNLRRSRGDTVGALAALDAAEAAGSNHPGIAMERGIIAASQDDLEAALEAFETAVERAPQDPLALENAARAAALTQKATRAAALYRRLLVIEPNRTDAWFALATVLFQQLGDKEAARKALLRAIALEPDPASRGRLKSYLRQLE